MEIIYVIMLLIFMTFILTLTVYCIKYYYFKTRSVIHINLNVSIKLKSQVLSSLYIKNHFKDDIVVFISKGATFYALTDKFDLYCISKLSTKYTKISVKDISEKEDRIYELLLDAAGDVINGIFIECNDMLKAYDKVTFDRKNMTI